MGVERARMRVLGLREKRMVANDFGMAEDEEENKEKEEPQPEVSIQRRKRV